ncbi:MAG: hypothetical protein ABEI86_01230 [Halobacteriaceae archaeon]
MTDPLEDLTHTIENIDIEASKEQHEKANQTVAETKEEIESWFADQLASEQKENVRTAYHQAVERDVSKFSNKNSFSLEEYPDEVDETRQRLLDILRNPEAQSLADKVDEWFVDADIDTLDSDERNNLIGVFKSDIHKAQKEIEEIIQGHADLQDMLPVGTNRVNHLLRDAVIESSSIEDLRSVREQLEAIVPLWSYPWTLDSEREEAEIVETKVNSVLEGSIKEVADRSDNFQQFSGFIEESFREKSDQLDNIRQKWSQIETEINRFTNIENIDSVPVVIEARIQNATEDADSIRSLVSNMKRLEDDVSILHDVAAVSLERFHPTADVSSNSFINIAELNAEYESAYEIRKSALTAETPPDIDQIKTEFEQHVNKAEEIIEQVEDNLRNQINSIRKLAQKFDLKEYSRELNDIASELNKSNDIDDYITVYNQQAELFEKVQEEISTEHLVDFEVTVFEWLLEHADSPDEVVDNLEAIRTVWPYPWNFDSNQTEFELIENNVNNILKDMLKTALEEVESPNELVTLANERFDSVDGLLSQLEEMGIIHQIETLDDTEVVDDPLRPAHLMIQDAVNSTDSLRDLVNRLEDITDNISMLNDIASEPLDKFSPPSEKIPDDLESEVSDLQHQYEKAVDIREKVFKSDSPDPSMSIDEFEQHVNKAEKMLQELREKTQQEIQMSKQLARKFDLDELLEQLDDISKQSVKANTVEDIIEIYSQVMEVYSQIREVIHDTLSSPEEDLLEWFIRKDDDVKLDSEVLRELATEFDCDETEIVDHFLSLQEDGFLDFLVKNPQHG